MGSTDETPPEIDGPPRRTSALTLALNLAGVGLALLVFLPQLLATNRAPTRSGSQSQSSVFLVIFVAALGFQLLYSVGSWFARTYTVGAREIVIDEGILARRRKVLPYARVQQVDINQRFLSQLLNICQLRIDTAGLGGGSVKLGMLDAKLARGIRSYILRRRAELQGTLRGASPGDASTYSTAAARVVPSTPTGPWAVPVAGYGGPGLPPGATPAAPETTLVQLGLGRLALAGITHHLIVIGIPALAAIGLWFGAMAALADRKLAAGTALVVSTLIGLGIGVFVAVMSVIQYTIGQFGFTLAKQGDDLHLRFGLFQVRNLTIPRRRVQHVTVVDNPFRRALGIVAIHLHSAAPVSGEQGRSSTRFEIPILDRADLDQFLHALMGGDWHVPPLSPRSAQAKRRAVTRRVMLLAVLVAVPALAFRPASLVLVSLALLGIPWGLAAHSRAGFTETREIVVLAHGVLAHHVDLLPYSRVQSCRSEQDPMQRWSRVRTVHVNVAGPSRDPHLYDMPDAAATAYVRDLPRRSGPASSTGGG